MMPEAGASRIRFTPCPLGGLTVVERTPVEDSRGHLTRLYSTRAFDALGLEKPVVQINHTLTRRAGTVRGLHFQRPPHAETKLVLCLRGEVLDVAVDLRKHSPTLLRWHAETLSASNLRGLLIPEGFAHGFQTLSPDVELIYLHTADYAPAAEDGVHPLDPRLGIEWPLEITEMSDRDRGCRMLAPDFDGVML